MCVWWEVKVGARDDYASVISHQEWAPQKRPVITTSKQHQSILANLASFHGPFVGGKGLAVSTACACVKISVILPVNVTRKHVYGYNGCHNTEHVVACT